MSRRSALMSTSILAVAVTVTMTAGCADKTATDTAADNSPPGTAMSSPAAATTAGPPAVIVSELPTVPPGKTPSKTASKTASKTPSRAPTRPPTRTASRSSAGGCPVLPADNIWHARATGLPVLGRSSSYVASIGAGNTVHPDFGSGVYDGRPFGMPVTTVPAGQAKVRVSFDYAGESDKGPYPIPANARIEGGPNADGDRHVIVLDRSGCRLYELFAAQRGSGGSWRAGSGAIFDLRSNTLRPRGWTSADAAGLPILPGLVRYEEVAAGRIDHAIRITAPRTRNAFVWPARHAASSSSDAALPAMGQRFRLKAGVDISGLPAQARVVAQALKTYGAILADNGSAWYLSGTQDDRWNNDALHALGRLRGQDFEAVDASGLMVSADSGRVR